MERGVRAIRKRETNGERERRKKEKGKGRDGGQERGAQGGGPCGTQVSTTDWVTQT